MNLVGEIAGGTLNPEALISAANAANAARDHALMAIVVAIFAVCILLIVGAITMFIAMRVNTLTHQTNSLVDRLLISTEQRSRAEGEISGRAKEQKENPR